MADKLVFEEDISRREIPVRVRGKDYILTEAGGDATAKFRNANAKCARFEDGKFVGVSGPIADVEAILVAACVFETNGDGKMKIDGRGLPMAVSMNTVRDWRPDTTKALFEKIKEISPWLGEKETREVLEKRLAETQEKLDRFDEDEAGNLPGATTAGSV